MDSSQETILKTVPLHTNPTAEQVDVWRGLSLEEQRVSVNIALDEAINSGTVDTTVDEIYEQVFGESING